MSRDMHATHVGTRVTADKLANEIARLQEQETAAIISSRAGEYLQARSRRQGLEARLANLLVHSTAGQHAVRKV